EIVLGQVFVGVMDARSIGDLFEQRIRGDRGGRVRGLKAGVADVHGKGAVRRDIAEGLLFSPVPLNKKGVDRSGLAQPEMRGAGESGKVSPVGVVIVPLLFAVVVVDACYRTDAIDISRTAFEF